MFKPRYAKNTECKEPVYLVGRTQFEELKKTKHYTFADFDNTKKMRNVRTSRFHNVLRQDLFSASEKRRRSLSFGLLARAGRGGNFLPRILSLSDELITINSLFSFRIEYRQQTAKERTHARIKTKPALRRVRAVQLSTRCMHSSRAIEAHAYWSSFAPFF